MLREEYLEIMVQLRRLNYNILRRIEIEFDLLKENDPEKAHEFVNIYTRLRKGILDDIGNTSRSITSEKAADVFEKH